MKRGQRLDAKLVGYENAALLAPHYGNTVRERVWAGGVRAALEALPAGKRVISRWLDGGHE
jgi:hypothetical protein